MVGRRRRRMRGELMQPSLTVAPVGQSAGAPAAPVPRSSARALRRRRRDRLVAAQRPTPETVDSPMASTRIASPMPGTHPWYGGFAGGRSGTRRRVTEPCAHASGRSASEPATPVASAARARAERARAGGDVVPPRRPAGGCPWPLEYLFRQRSKSRGCNIDAWRMTTHSSIPRVECRRRASGSRAARTRERRDLRRFERQSD